MNRYFELTDALDDFPLRAFARLDDIEPIDRSVADALTFVFDAVDADWPEFGAGGAMDLGSQDAVTAARLLWSMRFSREMGAEGDPMDRVPIYRVEFELSRSHPWFAEIVQDEEPWVLLKLTRQVTDVPVQVYGGLFAPPTPAFLEAVPSNDAPQAALTAQFDMKTWPDAADADVMQALCEQGWPPRPQSLSRVRSTSHVRHRGWRSSSTSSSCSPTPSTATRWTPHLRPFARGIILKSRVLRISQSQWRRMPRTHWPLSGTIRRPQIRKEKSGLKGRSSGQRSSRREAYFDGGHHTLRSGKSGINGSVFACSGQTSRSGLRHVRTVAPRLNLSIKCGHSADAASHQMTSTSSATTLHASMPPCLHAAPRSLPDRAEWLSAPGRVSAAPGPTARRPSGSRRPRSY